MPEISASEHGIGAIASRDEGRAAALAEEFDVPRSYGDTTPCWRTPIYVPLPNALHAEWTRNAADAGLDVLCEKPLAVDTAEARDVAAYCE